MCEAFEKRWFFVQWLQRQRSCGCVLQLHASISGGYVAYLRVGFVNAAVRDAVVQRQGLCVGVWTQQSVRYISRRVGVHVCVVATVLCGMWCT
jgi:hypothetical protein